MKQRAREGERKRARETAEEEGDPAASQQLGSSWRPAVGHAPAPRRDRQREAAGGDDGITQASSASNAAALAQAAIGGGKARRRPS
ncbi:hypothetical protein Syun_023982 [Stephania yunnanensis]|uniref:Uncharacterized protein n=1 Tax=Stephania yunnanensis TaxID=152371 RepID=A0AAP0I3M4_9MAGN